MEFQGISYKYTILYQHVMISLNLFNTFIYLEKFYTNIESFARILE